MIHTSSLTHPKSIQNTTMHNAPKNIAVGPLMQNKNQEAHFDKLELSTEAILKSNSLNVPSEVKIVIPRAWTIGIETIKAWNGHIKTTLEKSTAMNLDYNEHMKLMDKEGAKWVENIRQNDPEMFVQ